MYSPPLYDSSELEQISESTDKLIKAELESVRKKYWTESVAELSNTIESKPHYKHLVKGDIKIYGNACVIKENTFSMTEEERQDIRLKNKLRRNIRTPLRRKGDIRSFSKNSRHRMMKKMNRVDFSKDKISYFITLTYPDPYPTDGEIYKSDLDLFFKRLKREFGDLSYMWKLEVQFKRGAPHFHLILFFKKRFNIQYVKEWISLNWFEVAQRDRETKNEDHLKVGTNVKIVKTLRQLTNYVTKYITKKEQDDKLANQGRYWGCSRNWDDVKLEHHELTGQQLIIFRRLLKGYLRKTNRRMSKKMTSCPNIEIWAHWRFIFDALAWSSLMYD